MQKSESTSHWFICLHCLSSIRYWACIKIIVKTDTKSLVCNIKTCRHIHVHAQHMESHKGTDWTDEILSPCVFATKLNVKGGVESGDRPQQMAHLLLPILFLASSHSCATCGGGHTLWNRPPSPESGMQVIYLERSRSPQIKVCCASVGLFSKRFCASLCTCQAEWLWKSQWHWWEFLFPKIHFKHLGWSQKLKGLMFCITFISVWKIPQLSSKRINMLNKSICAELDDSF